MPPLGPRLYLHLRVSKRKYATAREGHTLLHDFVVVHRVTDVNVGLERGARDRWIEVEQVGWRGWLLRMQIRVDLLHEGGFSCSRHSDRNNRNRLLLLCI